jgi:hypothetical protein
VSGGNLSSAPIYPSSSGINALVYDSRGTQWTLPVAGYEAPDTLTGPETFSVPSVPSYSDSGNLGTTFFDDFYNRIHITPSTLALGALASDLTRTVQVWNSHLSSSETLDTIGASGDPGVSYTGPSLPTTFTPNMTVDYSVSIETDGPPVLSATYTYTFADGEVVVLPITGIRLVAWSVLPNWATAVTESLGFMTDVLRAWSGKEMRRSTRIAPRRNFKFNVLAIYLERRVIETLLFAWSSQAWALPIWPDGQHLTSGVTAGVTSITCNTANRDFVNGGLALLITGAEAFEVIQVGTVNSGSLSLSAPVQNTWGSDVVLFPVRQARILSFPTVSRDNGDVATIDVDFQIVEPCDWTPASGLPQYRGVSVLEDSPDDSSAPDSGFQRQANIIDNQTGALEVDDTAEIGFPRYSHGWWMQGSASRASFRALMYLLKGRWGELWVPSYQMDILLAADISSGANTILIQNIGYSTYAAAAQNRQDIRIELYSGTIYYMRITGATATSATTETLSMGTTFATGIPAATVRRISFMTLMRLSSDTIEITHDMNVDGLGTAVTPFVAVNNPI